jgi:hypothetical protein
MPRAPIKKRITQFTNDEIDAAGARSMKTYENVSGKATQAQRALASDSLGMVNDEVRRRGMDGFAPGTPPAFKRKKKKVVTGA